MFESSTSNIVCICMHKYFYSVGRHESIGTTPWGFQATLIATQRCLLPHASEMLSTSQRTAVQVPRLNDHYLNS